jgi:hypothetical protein
MTLTLGLKTDDLKEKYAKEEGIACCPKVKKW